MKGSGIAFDYIDKLFFNYHKVILNRGGSYIDSPEWIKKKKATVNLKIMMISVFSIW